eukprot:TRINITY_DN64594_c0_g1_i1.p1 TRINITY_DN64594_c0_g1~~TRINITY_DN64594_c0_g1_i1.p1  ORF type:complete len:175 (-),score=28.73 TRINITY_DN64594_c0_g1_i1:40-564(-)
MASTTAPTTAVAGGAFVDDSKAATAFHLRKRSAEFRKEIAGKRTTEKLRALGERQSDPELNMANERSFVRWAHISLYMLAIGGLLLRQVSTVLRICAMILIIYSCIMVIRAALRHRLRIKVLRKSADEAKIDDAFLENAGPQIYGVIVIGVLSMLGFTALVSVWPDVVSWLFPK